jgi:valyl-tRNA synthetase
MSDISKVYNPKVVEDKWYAYWLAEQFFKSEPDGREPYTIVIPPPNVTGVLHMGHMLNNTIQDVLIRRARMLGKNACWVPGTDHASIATEAKVVQMLRERGIKKSDLSRDEFLKYAWEWKEKYGGIILEQLKKLGCSCDWDRTRFTMEDDLSKAVIDVFIDLYHKGHIYRGLRMINWDPAGLTAVSDEEVIHKEVQSKLYYVRYKIENTNDEWITIATVRPETILGDTAVCVHPDDERYQHLKGKRCIIPIVNRSVPIIFDEYIDKEFGTGALKVTPAHDINDYNLGLKHHLEVIDTLTADGKLSEAAGHYIGEDRFVVRKKIVKDLEALGHLVKTEDYKNKVGYSERTDAVIEPRLSLQWFVNMPGITKPALEAVVNGEIKLVPDKFINTYRYWMENVKDWCISRQLWWGQRIPAWYDKDNNYVVAATAEEALALFKAKGQSLTKSDIKQDEDVLDTWFSSWLWPISVFDGFKDPDNKDIRYFYPTNDLVTAPEILFFWVARMIMAGYEYRKQKPFERVYLTGIVRDKLGRKMSKSLGNSPDPLLLIDQYGADGVRVGMLLCSPAGNDLLFDESYCEQGRNFANKMWNAFRLIKSWQPDDSLQQSDTCRIAAAWITEKFQEQLALINDGYQKMRISEVLMLKYKLFWDDFCAWYLELIKPAYGSNTIDAETYETTISIFENLLKLLHPFMPFITEELWHEIKHRKAKECIVIASWPEEEEFNSTILNQMMHAQNIISAIRNFRSEKGLSPKEPLSLLCSKDHHSIMDALILKSANLTSISIVEAIEKAHTFMAGTFKYGIPFSDKVDVSAERDRIEKEIAYNKGFLETVMKKLGNANFVSKAKPEVVAIEEKKKADAEQKIRLLQEQLNMMR